MLAQAKQLIERYAAGKRVAAAVSGGEDSMVLLHLLQTYAERGQLELSVVHVNHAIRAAADADSAFVAAYCREHGLAFTGVRVDIPALCAVSGRGVECEAHFARRDIFSELIRSGKADLVATAHHARDNAETVLLHLFRGCGLQGLSGMRVLSDDGLFRPLLTTEKDDLCAYAQANAVPFVTDETNADTAFDRNYIRIELLPRIKARFPAAESAICRTAGVAAEADAALAAHLCADAFTENGDSVSLREEYVSAPYILEALKRLGKRSDVYASAVETVLKLQDAKPCARVDVTDGIVAAKEYGAVTFYRKNAVVMPPAAFVLPPVDETAEIAAPQGTVALYLCRPPFVPVPKGELRLDADALPQHCVWRTRRNGDRFAPFGGGTKKVKEYLIDQKVPLRLRDSLPMLCCDNTVWAIAGMEIADAAKVTPQSRNVLAIRYTRGE